MTKKDQYRLMMTGLMFAFGMAAQYQTVPALLFPRYACRISYRNEEGRNCAIYCGDHHHGRPFVYKVGPSSQNRCLSC